MGARCRISASIEEGLTRIGTDDTDLEQATAKCGGFSTAVEVTILWFWFEGQGQKQIPRSTSLRAGSSGMTTRKARAKQQLSSG
jgi:hypothetical protein